VDPIYEITGIQRALEGGPALLFENIKGYPGIANISNLFSRWERVAKIFNVDDFKNIKFKSLNAMKKLIPPKIVETAPCQEVVILDDIDVIATLPILKHTERDAARILGGGITFVSGEYAKGGTEVSLKRMHFQGKSWATVLWTFDSHLGELAFQQKGITIPLTVNISPPPAVIMAAAAGGMHIIIPAGTDELGLAGGLQGSPIEICKAKTVDAYSIAQSEWVIEGYADTSQLVWETEEAAKAGKGGVAPLFPEWPGYLGRAYKGFKFQVTAITHRKDKPIFFSPTASALEGDIMVTVFRDAYFYELAARIAPGLVVDVHTLHGMKGLAGVVFQLKKRGSVDDGYPKAILVAVLNASAALRLAIAVDEDIDIYNADEVIWAISTRVHPSNDVVKGSGRGRRTLIPVERPGEIGDRTRRYYAVSFKMEL
jgi:4-hydroxy-3-polyprenylbenzoate decarboxylase